MSSTENDAAPRLASRPTRHRVPYVLAVVGLLVLGLVGGAAAGTLVTGKRIKDGSLLSRDIRNERINGADVRDGALRRADIVAPAGEPGLPGMPGPRGPHGAKGVEFQAVPVDVGPGGTTTTPVACGPGQRVVSGGVSTPALGYIHGSMPLPGGTGWQTTFTNRHSQQLEITFYAVCITDLDPA